MLHSRADRGGSARVSQPGSTLITEGDAEPGRLCERPSLGCMSMPSSPRPALQNGPFGTALMATPISQDRRHNGGDARAHDLLGRSHSARPMRRTTDSDRLIPRGRYPGGSPGWMRADYPDLCILSLVSHASGCSFCRSRLMGVCSAADRALGCSCREPVGGPDGGRGPCAGVAAARTAGLAWFPAVALRFGS